MSHRTTFLLERRKLNPNRMSELEQFGPRGSGISAYRFPEGTRGDGVNVAECQLGIYFIAQVAQLPIVPEKYLSMPREEFLELIREKIAAAKQLQSAAHLNPVPRRV